MQESYSGRAGAPKEPALTAPLSVAEPSSVDLARDLIARLVPGANADRLVAALLVERDARNDGGHEPPRNDGNAELSVRELERVRAQFALGAATLTLQHAFNNPLTALLAEAQLLQLEPLTEDHRQAVGRIVGLARRLVALARQLGSTEQGPRIGEL